MYDGFLGCRYYDRSLLECPRPLRPHMACGHDEEAAVVCSKLTQMVFVWFFIFFISLSFWWVCSEDLPHEHCLMQRQENRVKRSFPKLLMTKRLQGPRCQLLAAGLVLCTWDDQPPHPATTATLPYISLLLMYVPGRTILALFLYQYGSLTRYAKLRVVHAPGQFGQLMA